MKSAVSALQELCAKKQFSVPIYEYIDADDGGFECRLDVVDHTAYGKGRSKRDAKHLAAANALKMMHSLYPDIAEILYTDINEMPSSDMVAALRDFCVQNDHPLPLLDIIQQQGTPDAPEFTAICIIASIRRYGIAENKKDARQRAAYEMLKAIQNNEKKFNLQVGLVTSLDEDIETAEAERHIKFKTYRELIESKCTEMPGTKLTDRCNYFKMFDEKLKEDALKIIGTEYTSYEAQVLDILHALKIKPKISELPSLKPEPFVFIELNCNYDVVFCETKNRVYYDIVEYFKHMLV